METIVKKPFKLSDYIKDADLGRAIRNELAGLSREELAVAQDAIADTHASGVSGTFEQILDAYRQAVQRVIHPDRKLVKNPQIDRKLIRNPQLAAALDKELVDVTAEELAVVNAALKAIFDQARDLAIDGEKGAIRYVIHDASPICRVHQQRHPTVPAEDKEACGYFRAPDEWREVLRLEVRKALKR